jgi:hypothetical protein
LAIVLPISTMHTLMLHGHATSAFIFKAQTGKILSLWGSLGATDTDGLCRAVPLEAGQVVHL